MTGLEYATNLSTISIRYTDATNNLIGEIKSECGVSVYLTIPVGFDDSAIVKLDFLKKVKNLTELSIGSEDSTIWREVDYSALEDISTLTTLDVETVVAPEYMHSLENIKSLTTLRFGQTGDNRRGIVLDGIEGLTKLDYLCIKGYDILNANKLGELKNLKYLSLEYVTGVSDLSALAKCDKLESVGILSTDLSDVSFLENKKSVTDLSLRSSPIKNIKDMKDLILLVSTLPNLDTLVVDLEGLRIENLRQYEEMKKALSADELEMEKSNTENTEKTSTEAKTETKKQVEKPTIIPQAGINVVGNAISILVAISVVILAVAFVKAKRK